MAQRNIFKNVTCIPFGIHEGIISLLSEKFLREEFCLESTSKQLTVFDTFLHIEMPTGWLCLLKALAKILLEIRS